MSHVQPGHTVFSDTTRYLTYRSYDMRTKTAGRVSRNLLGITPICNTLESEQNGRHFADAIVKHIFSVENDYI